MAIIERLRVLEGLGGNVGATASTAACKHAIGT